MFCIVILLVTTCILSYPIYKYYRDPSAAPSYPVKVKVKVCADKRSVSGEPSRPDQLEHKSLSVVTRLCDCDVLKPRSARGMFSTPRRAGQT